MSSEVFLHGIRSNNSAEVALSRATQALDKALNAASVIYHEIGSYIFATLASPGVVQPNTLVAGSALRMAGGLCLGSDNKSSYSFNHISQVSLPGTWRCMGYMSNVASSMTAKTATLWVRVA